jgi:hypothetical protein
MDHADGPFPDLAGLLACRCDGKNLGPRLDLPGEQSQSESGSKGGLPVFACNTDENMSVSPPTIRPLPPECVTDDRLLPALELKRIARALPLDEMQGVVPKINGVRGSINVEAAVTSQRPRIVVRYLPGDFLSLLGAE